MKLNEFAETARYPAIVIQPTMAKEWIEQLTQDIRQKNRDAAEEFGRQQHRDDIIQTQGRLFFTDLEHCLDEDFTQVRRQLQGDPTAAEMSVTTTGATEVRLTRSRFPWFDAHVTHSGGTITMIYAKEPGLVGDPALLERKTLVFEFTVDSADKLSVRDAFGDQGRSYATPEELAQRITTVLLQS